MISFNPLHCGAVVASASPANNFAAVELCFNPLHCGAVVASIRALGVYQLLVVQVSIPFIAGQWSLPVVVFVANFAFREVSIPFIAGQWSLPAGLSCG